MKRLTFTEQQIAFILKQAEEGTVVEEVSARPAFRSRPTTAGERNTAG